MKEYLHILKQYYIEQDNEDIVEIKNMLQDQGTYLPVFIWFYAAGEIPFLELQQLYFKIKTYRELLRQYKITPLDVYKPKTTDAKKQYELLLDFIDEAISENQKENFARSFISKKYLKLVNRAAMEVLWKMHDELKLDRKKIQNLIFDKLAYYKYDTEFEESIIKTYRTLTQGTWNVEYLKIELREELIDVVFNDDYVLIARLDTYDQCKKVGARSWCIARSKSMFDMYTRNGTQYIVYNTKKERTHGEAVIGFTSKAKALQNSFLGVSYNQFDKPFEWKTKLVKYLKYMPCIKEVDVMPENAEEKVLSALNKNNGIDEAVIQKFNNNELVLADCKKLASYQKNSMLYGAIILHKEKAIDELLKDKNVNVNSDVIANFIVTPNNMVAAAVKMKDIETIKKLIKHRSCNQETLNSNYIQLLGMKNPDTNVYKIFRDLYKSDEQIINMMRRILKDFSSWTWRRNENNVHEAKLLKLLHNHKPPQSLINDFIISIKDHWNYNDILELLQSRGYGKTFKTKPQKTNVF